MPQESPVSQPESSQKSSNGNRARRMLAGTVLFSSLASVGNAATDTELPWTLHMGGGTDREWVETYRSVPATEARTETISVDVPPVVYQQFETHGMPFSREFHLDDAPEAARFTDEDDFNSYVESIKELIEQGYEITGIRVNGAASDEALGLQLPDAGIGSLTPENSDLAADRARYLAEQLDGAFEGMTDIKAATQPGFEATEDILDDTDVEATRALATAYGMSVEELLYSYNHNLDIGLTSSEKEWLDERYAQQRGAFAEVTLKSPTGQITYEVATEVCVRYVGRQEVETEKPSMPLTIIPGYIPRWPGRRRDESEDGAQPDKESPRSIGSRLLRSSEAWIASQFQQSESDVRYSDAIRELTEAKYDLTQRLRSQRFEHELADIERSYRPVSDTTRTKLAQAQQEVEESRRRIDEIKQRTAPERRARTRRRMARGALALAALAIVEPRFGYCPDPMDEMRSLPRAWEMPDAVDVRLRVPFTDIATSEASLYSNDCETDPSADPACIPEELIVENRHLDGTQTQNVFTRSVGR